MMRAPLTPVAALHALPLFGAADAAAVEWLARGCTVRAWLRGERLVAAGEPASHVYLLVCGSAKVVRGHPGGRSRIIHLLLRGDLLGAAVALQRGSYPVDAVALESTTAVQIAAADFSERFLLHPVCGAALTQQLSERLDHAHGDQATIYDAVEVRLARFLSDLLARVQRQFGPTTRIPVPLTRQDLAECIGSTVETVIRTMSPWTARGWIALHDRRIDLLDPAALCRLAESAGQ